MIGKERLHSILILLFIFICTNVFAQTDTTQTDSLHTLEDVVVTGFQPNSPHATSLNIEPYSLQRINEKAPFNLSDALAKLPGISQITTGNAISKPVIRGLYGNRILVLLSGLRFDNQQWQDEHGLGLSQIGIDRVEVIKGPASLLYGSDAVGGVINIIEEKPDSFEKNFDAGTQLSSNSLGTLTDVGYSNKTIKNSWRLRLGLESHADYSDGNNTRVLNSRNGGYYLKAGFGFDKSKWKQENSYNFSYNQFGFIINELNTFFYVDKRWSRSLVGPHHNVMLNLLGSQNTFYLKSSLLKLNLGVQSNFREEDEGGGQISLKMHLFSVLQNLRWEKPVSAKTNFVLNQQFTYTNNTNYGARVIIPDANFWEGNISGYVKFRLQKIIIETGAGINYKYIQTFATAPVNTSDSAIQPFKKNNFTGNALLGIVYNPVQWLTLKTNTASGFRAPNLAELSSNGLHEGTARYEIGAANLKVEQNINTDISIEATGKQWFLSASVFYNNFFNYVYLAPTQEQFYGFRVFRYGQQDAKLYGGEFLSIVKPVKWFQWKETFTSARGKLGNGGNLPFIPAFKLNSALRVEKNLSKKITNFFAEPELAYVFKQNKPAQFETGTGDYLLLNFSSGVTLPAIKGTWILALTANNITNTLYADHLSRLKYYGLYNEGINFVLSARRTISW
ncbi:MAG: TonB-dependent receptor [Parafilimonas sp.]